MSCDVNIVQKVIRRESLPPTSSPPSDRRSSWNSDIYRAFIHHLSLTWTSAKGYDGYQQMPLSVAESAVNI
ncbi:hypothetical protein F7725_015524 [Dissostichus mawsoni]|uniref:Uncharacterized protein n=1 Tax=Dissostichus mawsoni TaxID=36200 RepID=A0A7J5YKL0_DISMA|nr:hypothetical protein F7725_015524 [Dissostichus mawsoni]